MNQTDLPRRSWDALAALFIVTLIGGVLRLYQLGSEPLWVDEFATLRTALLPVRDIFAANLSINSFAPPLYFWLIHGVIQFLGDSEAAIRLPSALAGTLTIPVAWALTKHSTGNPRAALFGAALLAVNPLHIWYSQEARPYALLTLLVCLAALYLVLAVREHRLRYWVLFTICAFLAVCIQLLGLMLLAAAWVWTVFTDRRASPRPLAVSTAIVLLGVAPVLAAIYHASVQHPGLGSPPRPLTGLEIPYTAFTYLAGYSFGPSLREIQNLGGATAAAAHPVETTLEAIVLFGLAVIAVRNRRSLGTMLLILCSIYVGGAFVASAVTHKAYNVRYTLPAVVGFLGMIGVAVACQRPTQQRAWMALLVVLFLFADAQWFFWPSYGKDDSRAAAAWLADHLPPGATVGVAPAYVAGVLGHYLESRGARLRIVPVEGAGYAPTALLITRLHHVPARTALTAAFRAAANGPVVEHSVVGYEILTSTRIMYAAPSK